MFLLTYAQVVDPWGKVLCEIDDEIGVATADVDLGSLREIRQSLAVQKHRRSDVYSLVKNTPCVTSESKWRQLI